MYTGECNCCGQCCTTIRVLPGPRVVHYRCANLLAFDTIGRPGATVCAVWERRTPAMPIVMLGADGSAFVSRCLPEFPRPQDAVPPECSYTWQGSGPQC